MTILLFLLGLAMLIGGAEALVRGASRLAAAAGISPLVVGLTVVAFGTSSPELAVSVKAALSGPGAADVAIGNVVGSNTFNVLVILGLAALVAPLTVTARLVRLDVPLMIGVSFLLLLLAADGAIGRGEGLLLFAGVIVYTGATIVVERKRAQAATPDEASAAAGGGAGGARRVARDLLLIAAGLGLLVVGSKWLVDGAVAIARHLGVSELIVSLTVVAAGTSLPEVATSVLASIRGERDIAVGNVVGSNLFNILAVLGAAALVSPGGIAVSAPALRIDIPVMIAVAVACLPIFFTGYRVSRGEGALFLAYYGAYAGYLFLAASRRPEAAWLSPIVLYAVVPATVLVLAIAVVRQVRARRP